LPKRIEGDMSSFRSEINMAKKNINNRKMNVEKEETKTPKSKDENNCLIC
jgi:hypothetical protein